MLKNISKIALIITLATSSIVANQKGKTLEDNPLMTFNEMIDTYDEKDMKLFKRMLEYTNMAQLKMILSGITEEERLTTIEVADLQKKLGTSRGLSQKAEYLRMRIEMLQSKIFLYLRKMQYIDSILDSKKKTK